MLTAAMSDRRHTWKARWVFPVSSPPVENGCVEVEAGRISTVHNRAASSDCTDLGNVALIPGLVNAHTHLEFSALETPLEPAGQFSEWIGSVMRWRTDRGPASATILAGAAECLRTGTTTVGEISTDDSTLPFNPRIVSFRELIGFSPERIEAQLEIARQHLDQSANGNTLKCGLSPHAPYSVHPDLLRRSVDLAVERDVPLAMHLAETPAEIEYVQRGTGEFVEFLKRVGLWQTGDVERHDSILFYLRELARVRRSLAVHCNSLSTAEIQFLGKNPHVAVVYCPRTHKYFGHTRHPWRELIQQHASVAIGTDGRCSNPDLNMWREAQLLYSNRETISPAKVLELVTLAGSKALGLEDETGTLQPGRAADLAVVELSSKSADPFEALFGGGSVVGTIRNGTPNW
ncbi:MAG: amidohydrolase family protein [Planctomycetota bacterium]|nr:amidohydrolase family protein [Planctomycetota bacterium]